MGLLVKNIVTMAQKQLEDAGIENAKGECEALYCHLMKVDRSRFFMEWAEEADDRTCEQFFDLVARRTKREPLQYITGKQAFLDFELDMAPGVLIPRLDTEVVTNTACDIFKEHKGDTVLEIGCGSGAISIALAKNCKAKVTAVDVNPKACENAKQNATKNGVKIDVLCGDMYEPIKKKKYNMIISNPPYIKSGVIPSLMPEVKDFEPLDALDGGVDGLEFYRHIVKDAPQHLKKNGLLVFEIGHDQAAEVTAIITVTDKFEEVKVGRDLDGKDRVVIAQLKKR